MSLGVHQKSDLDLENIRRFYSLGRTTEKQSTLAGLQTKKRSRKETFDWFSRIPLDLLNQRGMHQTVHGQNIAGKNQWDHYQNLPRNVNHQKHLHIF